MLIFMTGLGVGFVVGPFVKAGFIYLIDKYLKQ